MKIPIRDTKRVIDVDTLAELCATQDDFNVAVIPSAPKEAIVSGLLYPPASILHELRPHPDATTPQTSDPPTNTDILQWFKDLEARLDEADTSRKEAAAAAAEVLRKNDSKEAEELRRAGIKKVSQMTKELKRELKTLKKEVKRQLNSRKRSKSSGKGSRNTRK
ncbi:hypothetical protein H0H81_000874 [Sphagnurus paluster]|uniref:Uncharacterized protein n=1 Tax=Sphagnurus paluster TaxID=117069 RepID=A0A9P7GRQ8_9AGAR|nr:hypothetical protein H0H81_000874 [Sphagnurus paluster]